MTKSQSHGSSALPLRRDTGCSDTLCDVAGFAVGPSAATGHPSAGQELRDLLLLQPRTKSVQKGNQHLRCAQELGARQGTG